MGDDAGAEVRVHPVDSCFLLFGEVIVIAMKGQQVGAPLTPLTMEFH